MTLWRLSWLRIALPARCARGDRPYLWGIRVCGYTPCGPVFISRTAYERRFSVWLLLVAKARSCVFVFRFGFGWHTGRARKKFSHVARFDVFVCALQGKMMEPVSVWFAYCHLANPVWPLSSASNYSLNSLRRLGLPWSCAECLDMLLEVAFICEFQE